MVQDAPRTTPPDSRVAAYRVVKQIVLICAVFFVVKSCVMDSAIVGGDQMSPTLERGDRVLIFKMPYFPVLRNIFGPRNGKPVLFKIPHARKYGCLRIVAVSGDTVSIDSAELVVHHEKGNLDKKKFISVTPILPREYSPRDFMYPIRIPSPGDAFRMDSLPLRDFFFVTSAIRQENPDKKYTLKTLVIIDDSIYQDYYLKDFSLYKGSLSTVPQEERFNWFFWDRLQEYLRFRHPGTDVNLYFQLFENGTGVDRYIMKKPFVFMLADNWTGGLDSRYFGPVITSAVAGRLFFVIWSFGNTQKHDTFRIGRVGKIVW